MPRTSTENLQRYLQAAFETQHQEHEQSVHRFLETIAGLCDEGDGPTMAKALRSLPQHSTAALGLQPQHLNATGAAPLPSLPSFLGLSSTVGPSIVGVDEYGVPTITSGDIDGRPTTPSFEPVLHDSSFQSIGAVNNGVQADGTILSSATQDMDEDDVKYMKQQFAIEHCTFISDKGEIVQPASALSRTIGPRGRELVARFRQCVSPHHHGVEKQHHGLLRFIESGLFKFLSAMAITLNYFFIIVQTDWKMSNLNKDLPGIFKAIDLTFTSYYTFEVGITIFALRSRFFFGAEWTWNWFDLIIVFFSVGQEGLDLMNIKAIDTSFLRVLRFFKISKILRMFEAMRSFKEVKIMVDSLQGSFMVFIWCVLMLGLYLSVFGIFFVQGLTTRLEDLGDTIEAAEKEVIHLDFGSVLSAMVSLFMAVSGGNDWSQYHETIKELGPVYSVLLMFFVLFAMMAFFNVVTGVFCEKAMSLAHPGPDELFMRRQAEEVRDARELKMLLKRILGIEGAPRLSVAQIVSFMEHKEVLSYFGQKGLNVTSARRYFQVLADIGGSAEIDFNTFVSACVKLDSAASGIDLHVINVELKAVQMSLHHVRTSLTEMQLPGRDNSRQSPSFDGAAGRMNSRTQLEDSPVKHRAAAMEPQAPSPYELIPPPSEPPSLNPDQVSNFAAMFQSSQHPHPDDKIPTLQPVMNPHGGDDALATPLVTPREVFPGLFNAQHPDPHPPARFMPQPPPPAPSPEASPARYAPNESPVAAMPQENVTFHAV